MKTKQTTLAAALAAATLLGASGQAAASIYARSYLEIYDLSIFISDDGGNTAGGAEIDNFNFTLTNTADLDGNAVIGTGQCGGLPSPGANTCDAGSPTLDADVQNAPGSTVLRGENDFTFYGPGTDQYSNSDSVIYTSELSNGNPTNTEQIAESELQTGTSTISSAEIQSTTGFTFEFTVTGADLIAISFYADTDRWVEINDLVALTATAQSNSNVEFQLENDDTGDFIVWRPNGTILNGCAASFGACTELSDDWDLQKDFGVTTLATSSAGTSNYGGFYQMVFSGLYDGDWTLTLNAVTSTSTSRTVPEPGMLALLGIGLSAMGLGLRRRKQA